MTLTRPTPIARPSLVLLGAEPWRAAYEFARLKIGTPSRRQLPGDGHPVIIFPGLAADGSTVAPMRKHLDKLGYSAMDWGRGFNRGPSGNVDAWLAELAADVQNMLKPYDQKATLIGWSLGGFYAREVGKLLAPQLRQVITIGTPFNAAADHTHVGWVFKLLNGAAPAYDPELTARLRTAPPLPTTSIYSKSDGIVAWQTCRHENPSEQVLDIEVDGSHCGMGWNPAVLGIVAERLHATGRSPEH